MMHATLKTTSVFLADDDHDDCQLFEAALNDLKLPISLTTLHDGEQLMQWLFKVPDSLPDILFLDINMPRKNGFECLADIKQDKKLKALTVVVFSTTFQQDVINTLYQHGADYFICKPNTFQELKRVIGYAIKTVCEHSVLGKFEQPNKENFILS
jgi:CheY-like chemotaxis protein